MTLPAQGDGADAASPLHAALPSDAMRSWAFETIRLESGGHTSQRVTIAIEADLLGYRVVERASQQQHGDVVRQWFAPTLLEAVILTGRITHDRLSDRHRWRRTRTALGP